MSGRTAAGEYQLATEMAEEGLRLARATTGKRREGLILIELGRVKQATGDHDGARSVWQQAADILQQISPKDEATALNLLAAIQIFEAEGS